MTCRGIQKFHTTQTFFISKHVYETDSVHEKDSNLQVINTLRFAWHQNICIFFFIRFFFNFKREEAFSISLPNERHCQKSSVLRHMENFEF